jgi:hypothetical protein
MPFYRHDSTGVVLPAWLSGHFFGASLGGCNAHPIELRYAIGSLVAAKCSDRIKTDFINASSVAARVLPLHYGQVSNFIDPMTFQKDAWSHYRASKSLLFDGIRLSGHRYGQTVRDRRLPPIVIVIPIVVVIVVPVVFLFVVIFIDF